MITAENIPAKKLILFWEEVINPGDFILYNTYFVTSHVGVCTIVNAFGVTVLQERQHRNIVWNNIQGVYKKEEYPEMFL